MGVTATRMGPRPAGKPYAPIKKLKNKQNRRSIPEHRITAEPCAHTGLTGRSPRNPSLTPPSNLERPPQLLNKLVQASSSRSLQDCAAATERPGAVPREERRGCPIRVGDEFLPRLVPVFERDRFIRHACKAPREFLRYIQAGRCQDFGHRAGCG